jgi:hypothetical protein
MRRTMITDVVSVISRSGTVAMLAVRVAVLLVLLFLADHLIERRPFFGRAFWVLVDSGVHGLVALLVTAPILRSPQLLVLAFLAGTLVDVDHFLATGSRSVWTATHLEKRPPTHSVTFALLVGGGGYLFSESLTTAWVVFAALTSLVLRDASVGTAPLLWPLGDWTVPRCMYYMREAGLALASRRTAKSAFPGIP